MVGLTRRRPPAAERFLLGREGVPLVIIDNAYPAPAALCAVAQERQFCRTGDDFYPGMRADAPADYPDWIAALATDAWSGVAMSVVRAALAVATDTPADLAPIQRIPHFDTVDARVVAAVHYLCEPPHGGTSFYRHRRTGYERIDRSRQNAWRQALNRDVREFGMPAARDLPADAASFERIGSAALCFNRLILYPANCLHAGDLSVAGHDDHPDRGRLTITSLLRPKSLSSEGSY